MERANVKFSIVLDDGWVLPQKDRRRSMDNDHVGILLDHAAGVVIGETVVVGNNLSILHHMTLGETGKVGGDRHPMIGDGVLIGAGVTVLGNVKIGEEEKIGAGSLVMIDVPAWTTTVGNPTRLVEGKRAAEGSKMYLVKQWIIRRLFVI